MVSIASLARTTVEAWKALQTSPGASVCLATREKMEDHVAVSWGGEEKGGGGGGGGGTVIRQVFQIL